MEGMKRIIVALAGIALAVGLALVVSGGVAAVGPVYTVSELRADLAHDPQAWLGHTVLVRGMPVGAPVSCPATASCAFMPLGLMDPPASRPGSYLLLSMGPPNPLLALLRRLPLVGRFMPGPQLLRWTTPAIYRIQIQGTAGTSRGVPARYEALLLDAAPPAHGPLPIWRGYRVLLVKPVGPVIVPVVRPLPPPTIPTAGP